MAQSSRPRRRPAGLAKLSPPSLPLILERKRLYRRLDQARKRPIVWITAPPGSGKTTLVAGYLRARKLRALWYQVDEGDADLATFFHYLGLAGRKAAPRARRPLPHLTPEYLQALEIFARRFFEELFGRLKPPVVVVFDNIQLVPDTSHFYEVLEKGLSEIPPGVSVLLVSRAGPPPALAALRAGRRMATIDEDSLELADKEATRLVTVHARTNRQPVPPPVRAQLVRQSHGWVAGLVLLLEQRKTGQPPAGTGVGGTPEVVFEYLAREVLKQLDPETQGFLLKTAFCPSMTAAMAEQLTGVAAAQQILARLHRSRYFTECRQGAESVYQYHPLFREFLRATAARTLSLASRAAVARESARLLEQTGRVEEAVTIFHEARQHDEVARVILAQAPAFLAQGRARVVEDWIRRLPVEQVEHDPWLLFWLGNSRMPFDPNESATIFERAFHRFTATRETAGALLTLSLVIQTITLSCSENIQRMEHWLDRLPSLDADHVAAEAPALQARLAFANILGLFWRRIHDPEARAWLTRAASLLEQIEGLENQTMMAWYLVSFRLWLGDLVEAEEVVTRLRHLVASRPVSPLAKATCLAVEAQYGWLAGDPATGLRAAREGLALAEEHGLFLAAALLWPQACYNAIALSDRESAEQCLKDMQPVVEPMPSAFGTQYHFMAGWLEALRGEYQQALQRIDRCLKIVIGEHIFFIEVLWRLAAAHVLHELRRPDEADTHLTRAEEITKAAGSVLHEFQCRLIRARWAFDAGREPEGLDVLREAMAIGRTKRLVNFSWWCPEVMARLCAKALEAGIEPDYVTFLIGRRKLSPPASASEAWPWPVKVKTLGRFAVEIDGQPVAGSRKAPRRLFAVLKALIAGSKQETPAASVTDALWPDSEGDAAYRSLVYSLSRLRRLLKQDAAVALTGGLVRLDPSVVWTDVAAFERLAQQANEAEHKGCGPEAQQLTERARLYYQGPFLPDDVDEPWTQPARERLRTMWMRLVQRQHERWARQKEWDRLRESAERAIHVDPSVEACYQDLILALVRQGRHEAAHQAYRRCRLALAGFHGREPLPDTTALLRDMPSSRPRNL